jgi:hypothetical protein
MAVKTTLEQLEEVQAAISKVMNAQSGSIGDKALQRARLDLLTAREEMLLKRYNAESGTGGVPAFNTAIPKRLY